MGKKKSETHTLTLAEMPPHTHTITDGIVGQAVELSESEIPEHALTSASKRGVWALQGIGGKFVSREGFWVGASDAAHFPTEELANQFNDRECEGLYLAVEI